MQAFVDTQQCAAHIGDDGRNDNKGWYYRQANTGKVFRSFGWTTLIKAIHSHRSAMASSMEMDLENGWIERVEDEMCREGRHERECNDRQNPGPWVSELAREGRRLWNELHAHALAYPLAASPVDIAAEKKWLLAWEFRIPDFSCRCKGSYDLITRTIPPVFTGRKDYYLWTWEVHEAVNAKLGRPAFVLPEETLALLEG
mgnify:CR=1 FL=1